MTRPNFEDGVAYWRDEVAALDRPEREVPYQALIPLVGIYVVSTANPEHLTSFRWRQSVLESEVAVGALSKSLTSMFKDELDDTFEIPLDSVRPSLDSAAQLQWEYESIMNGMPVDQLSMPWNEWFLARHLGFSCHDDTARLEPLRLLDQGLGALHSHYPKTAEYVERHA